jgi:hypothetical protein
MHNRKILRVANGDLVILKGGLVSRVERVEPPDRVLVETFYPRQGLRLVSFDHILDLATRRCAPGEGP